MEIIQMANHGPQPHRPMAFTAEGLRQTKSTFFVQKLLANVIGM